MGRRGVGGEGSALKRALLVTGGLVLAWLTVETAFKPLLDSLRAAISRSDPARDTDDELEDLEEKKGDNSGQVKAPNVEEEEEKNGKED